MKGKVFESSVIYDYLTAFSVSNIAPECLTCQESQKALLHIEFALKTALICILHHRELLVNFHTVEGVNRVVITNHELYKDVIQFTESPQSLNAYQVLIFAQKFYEYKKSLTPNQALQCIGFINTF